MTKDICKAFILYLKSTNSKYYYKINYVVIRTSAGFSQLWYELYDSDKQLITINVYTADYKIESETDLDLALMMEIVDCNVCDMYETNRIVL